MSILTLSLSVTKLFLGAPLCWNSSFSLLLCFLFLNKRHFFVVRCTCSQVHGKPISFFPALLNLLVHVDTACLPCQIIPIVTKVICDPLCQLYDSTGQEGGILQFCTLYSAPFRCKSTLLFVNKTHNGFVG